MLFTVPQFRTITDLSTATIYRMFKNGQLKKVKIGGSTRIEMSKELQEQYKDKINKVI